MDYIYKIEPKGTGQYGVGHDGVGHDGGTVLIFVIVVFIFN